jgi:hypothetical protein
MRRAKLLLSRSLAHCFSNASKLGIRISLGPSLVGLGDPHGWPRLTIAEICDQVGLPIQATIWNLSSNSRWWRTHLDSYLSLVLQILNSHLPGSNHRLTSTRWDNFLSSQRQSVPSCWVSSNSRWLNIPMDKNQLYAPGLPPAQTRRKERGNQTISVRTIYLCASR